MHSGYSVCWSTPGNDYRFTLGDLFVVGPSEQNHACVLGGECKMELNLIQNLHRVGADGSLDANNTHRAFSIEIKLKPTLVTTANVTLSCSAPVDRFAFLEQEGHTYIHSTVMADCTAFIKKTLKKAQTFVSTGVNLLEIKE